MLVPLAVLPGSRSRYPHQMIRMCCSCCCSDVHVAMLRSQCLVRAQVNVKRKHGHTTEVGCMHVSTSQGEKRIILAAHNLAVLRMRHRHVSFQCDY